MGCSQNFQCVTLLFPFKIEYTKIYIGGLKMTIAWIAILPVVILTIGLACYLIYYVAKNNKTNSHVTIDPKPQQNYVHQKKEESL